MNTLTLTGPAHPTHNTPFDNGWYIKDTFAVGFLSDTPGTFDHLVGRRSKRVQQVIDETDPVGEKSVTFIKHDNEYWVKEPWDLPHQLSSFDEHIFTYDDEFIFQPLYGSVHTGTLDDFTNNSSSDKTVLQKLTLNKELLVVPDEEIKTAVENNQIHRLQPANKHQQY